MRYFKHGGKIAEEIGYVPNGKVVFFKYLKEEDKDKCPHCNKALDIQHDIVEGSLNWKTEVKAIETLPDEAIKNNHHEPQNKNQ